MPHVLLLSLLWLGQTAATGSIRGVVIDARTAAPVVDARVTIVEAPRESVTAPDGRFEFTSLQAGTYTLTVSRIDYAFVRRRIEVAAGSVEITIPIAEGTGTYQERVTVTSDTADRTAGPVRTAWFRSAAGTAGRGG